MLPFQLTAEKTNHLITQRLTVDWSVVEIYVMRSHKLLSLLQSAFVWIQVKRGAAMNMTCVYISSDLPSGTNIFLAISSTTNRVGAPQRWIERSSAKLVSRTTNKVWWYMNSQQAQADFTIGCSLQNVPSDALAPSVVSQNVKVNINLGTSLGWKYKSMHAIFQATNRLLSILKSALKVSLKPVSCPQRYIREGCHSSALNIISMGTPSLLYFEHGCSTMPYILMRLQL